MSTDTSDLFLPQQARSRDKDDDDEDNLSIASTVVDSGDPDQNWFVDDVLAERPHPEIPGAVQYLIKWEDYPLEDATWEPVENLGDDLVPQWEEVKSEIAQGTRQPFDLAEYTTALDRRGRRHERRNAKRQRLGLDLTYPYPPGLDPDGPSDSDNDEAQEVMEIDSATFEASRTRTSSSPKVRLQASSKLTPKTSSNAESLKPMAKPKLRLKTASSSAALGSPQSSSASPVTPATSKKPKQKTFFGIAASDKPQKAHEPLKQPLAGPKAPSVSTPPGVPQTSKGNQRSTTTITGYQGTARRSGVFRSAMTKSSARPLNGLSAGKVKATRTSQQPQIRARPAGSTNVFAGGITRKKRTGLADAMTDPSKAAKPFSNMHKQNLARKRTIEKNEAVGALSSIPSKFLLGNNDLPSPINTSKQNSPTEAIGQGQSAPTIDQIVSNSPIVSAPHHPQFQSTPGLTQRAEEPRPPVKRKKSVRFTEEEHFEAAPSDMAETPTNMDAEDKPASLAIGPSHVGGQLPTQPLAQRVEKSVRFGKSEAVRVIFTGVVQQQTGSWLSVFKNREALSFATTCTSFHFTSQKADLVQEILLTGVVEPASPEQAAVLNNVAEWLRNDSTGLHLVQSEFSILIFPTRCRDWASFNSKNDVAGDLCHLTYRWSPSIDTRLYPAENALDPAVLDELYPPASMDVKTLIKSLTGLDYDKMLPQETSRDKDKQAYMFLIPLKQKQLLGVLKAWLLSCQPNCEVYTLERSDAWPAFHHTAKAGSGGTIICHSDITTWKLERISSLWEMLQGHRYTFWDLNTGENNPPLYPSDLSATVDPARLQLTRLFPFGKAFLITPSFVISDPRGLYNFLEWFKSQADNPHYLLVGCFNFPQFLRDITEEKERERSLLRRDFPGVNEEFLKNIGRGEHHVDLHFKAWELLRNIMAQYGDDETSEDVRKVFWANEFIDPSDEESLVNWFCWWSSTKLDMFRRFYVIGSSSEYAKRAYRNIAVLKYFDSNDSNPEVAAAFLARKTKAWEAKQAKGYDDIDIAWASDVGPNGEGGIRLIGPPRKSHCRAKFAFPGKIFSTDDIGQLHQHIRVHRHRTRTNWADLHDYPVAWRDSAMADQFGDGGERSQFDTFSHWIDAAPQFHPKKNTWCGIFYTIVEEWDPDLPKRRYSRHPWIAVWRPACPHLLRAQGIKNLELFIWDAAADDREYHTGRPLLDMQCQLIDLVKERVKTMYPGCSLIDVWYGSHTEIRPAPNDNVLDKTWSRLSEMYDDWPTLLPTQHELIVKQKWRHVDPRLYQDGQYMSPFTPKKTAWGLQVNGVPRNEKDKHKPERSIWHPTTKTTIGPHSRCINSLHEACRMARVKDPNCEAIRHSYPATRDWYANLVNEGRNHTYICVDSAQKILKSLGLPQYQNKPQNKEHRG
ncbi:hypothetical protein F5Y18DRAFT_106879 [Xylariaceae sp. FL1019]|nr:hypothetical protein F5Y18DRAFT_106879 [Xylariaceae sp. FL1019]